MRRSSAQVGPLMYILYYIPTYNNVNNIYNSNVEMGSFMCVQPKRFICTPVPTTARAAFSARTNQTILSLPVLDTLTDKRKRNAVGFGEYGIRCGRRFMGNSIVKCT